MQTKTTFNFLSASLICFILTACGGGSGGSSALDNQLNGGTSTNGTTNWRIGNGSGSTFVSGALAVDPTKILYAGGSVAVSFSIVNESGNYISDSIPVQISSPCLANGTAKIAEGASLVSTTGLVTFQYQPTNCVGKETVTATATYKNKTLSATGIVNINNIRLGLGNGVSFIPTKLDLGANYLALFTGQTTLISVNVVNDNGDPVATSMPVTLSSGCINSGASSITGGNTINSNSGQIIGEYKAGTCFGDDTVTASVNYAGNIISASATIPQVNNKRIGSGTGGNFTPGQMTASTSTTLFQGDTTQLIVNIVDNQSNLVSQAVQVSFDSPCISAGQSTVAGGNVVNSINGVAKIQYTVGQCSIDDTVTATIANGNSTIDASISLPIDTRRLGSGFGASFVNGALELGIGSGALSPGGTTTVTAYIVNSNGDLVTDPMNVTFSSPCISAGNAVIAGGNTVTSANGKAIATYTSQGCAGIAGVDTIKATASFRSVVLSASSDLAVKSDSAQTIKFVGANPSPTISIKGTGGQETSILTFQVLGQGGTPLKGVCVTFAPSTTVGGLGLVPSKCNPAGPETYGSTTDSNGNATTTVQAGTVATPVRVTATTSNGISTQSSALAISTGIPDQNSMSLSADNLQPIGWEYDGVVSNLTIRLADAFNNPVPDGTSVSFTTSGGAIDPNCTTGSAGHGACTVVWRSQSPRPVSQNQVSFDSSLNMVCPAAQDSNGYAITECRSGRIKVLATAIGNESFIDGNGNGLYDDPTVDIFVTHSASNSADANKLACNANAPKSSASVGTTKGCDDLPEAYLDGNFNGNRSNDETFVDFNQNGTYDSANGKYDGALCAGTAKANGQCTTNKVTVRDDITLTMACTTPFISGGKMPGLRNIVAGDNFHAGSIFQLPFLVADCNGNGMPSGTTISYDKTNLLNVDTVSLSQAKVGQSTEPTITTLTLTANATNPPSGYLIINVTSPAPSSGTVTTTFTIKVN